MKQLNPDLDLTSMQQWRRDLHAHPETAFEETRTASKIASLLTDWGLEVHTGIAGTGVVGVLRGAIAAGERPVSLGFRADMDALHLTEQTQLDYQSTRPGKMHACGHDGHVAMLLGAAQRLAQRRHFKGVINFIFQPAEENEGGGRRMVEEGLFERFPCDSVWAVHNWPELPLGRAAVRAGPMMAAFDRFEITVQGKGGHGAMPHLAIDPIVIAGQIVSALQTIVSRQIPASESAVVSVTRINAGHTDNVIPDACILGGTVRTFSTSAQDRVKTAMETITSSLAHSQGGQAHLTYTYGYPATINAPTEAEIAAEAAASVLGADNVLCDLPPSMAGEDFAFMLAKRPGAYLWLGQNRGPGDAMVHSPNYDFNDALLALGASYWLALAERLLTAPSASKTDTSERWGAH
jgi:hippurate hydrolase